MTLGLRCSICWDVLTEGERLTDSGMVCDRCRVTKPQVMFDETQIAHAHREMEKELAGRS